MAYFNDTNIDKELENNDYVDYSTNNNKKESSNKFKDIVKKINIKKNEKEDTNSKNIDNDNNKNTIESMNINKEDNSNKDMIAIIALIAITLLVIWFLFFRSNGSYIVLDGGDKITIYQNTEYTELGYHGYDKNDNDITNLVSVKDNIDPAKIGDYTVTYSVKGTSKKREVSVVEKQEGSTYIYLKGDMTIYLQVGEDYNEPGYIAVDKVDSSLSDKVTVSNNINKSKPGNYQVIYSVVNSAGITSSISRTVVVLGGEINLSLSNSNKTTGELYINVYVNDNHFSYLILPDGKKITDNKYSYKVTKNATYSFTAYDDKGTKTQNSITVSNIVTPKPSTGSSGNSSGNSSGGSSNGNSSGGNSSSGGSSNTKPNTGSSNNGGTTQKPTVTVSSPKLYTSDNIGSGSQHTVGFLVKIIASSGTTAYYCQDSTNSCTPSTKYSGQIRFASSTQAYIRYRACDTKGNCSATSSYKVNLSINEKNPSVSSSGGIANPWQAAFYLQGDYRWGSTIIQESRNISTNGCGYTGMAMMITGLTKNYSITPKTVLDVLKSSGKWFAMSESDCTGCGGQMQKPAVKILASYYGFSSAELFDDWSGNYASTADKKSMITQSLKMGHMIIVSIPGHYIVFAGQSAGNELYVLNPAGTGWKGGMDYVWNYYYDYKSRCTNKGNCGIKEAYEVYPSNGMSLAEWKKLG